MNKTVYKIVFVNDMGLWSYNTSGDVTMENPRKGVLSYEPKKLVRPPFGKLFAFETEEAATNYLGVKLTPKPGEPTCFQIWRARGNGVCKLDSCVQPTFSSYESLENFWKKENNPKIELMKPPLGTVFCTSLRLLEKVR